MARALVLNATYEPLSVVSQRRAAILVFYGRADSVHGSGRVIRSAHQAFELPSVVRLRNYVRVPDRRPGTITRRGVFARDGDRCQYCGGRAESIDHVRPRSRGGEHTWENVVAACKPCNTRKRDRLLSEIRMSPRTVPRPPGRFAWVRQTVSEVPETWLAYIEPARVGVRANAAAS